MGLEDDEHTAVAGRGPRGRERHGHLPRMVPVVVVDPHPAPLAAQLEAAPGARELGEHAFGLLARHARDLERRKSRRRIAAVVLTRDRELERDGLELVPAHDLARTGEPVLEQLPHLGLGGEGRVVVELDVRQHGDLRPQQLQRPVRLVALGDEPALPRARIPGELRDLAADQKGRIEPEPVEHERDHRRGRRLAVCAGDDDRGPQFDELGQQLRPLLLHARA